MDNEKDMLENEVIECEMETLPADEEKKIRVRREVLDWAKTLLFYCILPVVLFECFCFIANVPTGSMETTVPTHSQVLVTRCFNKNNVKPGDVVVFYNDELEMVLFKRCIAVGGDTVEFPGDGSIYINGEYFDEPYVSTYSDYEGYFEVPEDCYFFCGDNRGASLDARYWDNPYIEKSKVMGIARFIILPFDSFGTID